MRRHQGGAAALLMILTLIVILTIVLAPRLTLWQVRNAATGRGYQALIDAKTAILAHASSPDADSPVTRILGQITLTPDLPTTAATTYTGLAGLTPALKPGCATTTWVPGQPLIDPNTMPPTLPLAQHANIRCFGRLPWLSYGLPGPSNSDDVDGEVPWMFVSANLVGVSCVSNLNPLMLSFTYAAACPGPVPFPWLTVVDARGNVLSSQVAIVLILPGPSLTAAQQRSSPTDRSPSAYLDSLTVSPGCSAPCVPGTYNNANYTAAGGAWTFVDAPPSTALGPPPAYYQQPFTFNDRLIYITASEYLEAMERRARAYVVNALAAYKFANGYLPYPGDQSPLTRNCNTSVRFGLIPTLGCGGAPALLPPNWYTNAGWGNYFVYAVDPQCIAALSTPQCPGSLRLGTAATHYNAVLFSPGRAITTAPFAASKIPTGAQVPITAGGTLGSLADFLDSAKNTAGGPQFDAAGTLATTNYNDRMYGIP